MPRYQDAIQALIDTAHRKGHDLILYSHKVDLDVVYTLVDLTTDTEVSTTCFIVLAYSHLLDYINNGFRHNQEVNND